MFAIWVSFLAFCPAFVPGYLRLLRVTNTLLIVVAGREGSHWVLTTLSIHSRLWLHPIQWEWGSIAITYKLLGYLGYSHSSPPTEAVIISVTLPLYRPIITWCAESYAFILRFWKTPVMQDLMKIYSLNISPQRVVLTQRNQAGQQSHLVHMLTEGFSGPL